MAYNYIEGISTEDLIVLIRDIKEELKKRNVSLGKKKAPKIHEVQQYPLHQREKGFMARISQLDSLLEMDWSYLFESEPLCTEKKFYVYVHIDPNKPIRKLKKYNISGIPFYIGKGTGERAFDFSRTGGHRLKLNKMIHRGVSKTEIVNIVMDNMTEQKALELESKLIYFFATKYEQDKGTLLNLDVGKRPQRLRFPKIKRRDNNQSGVL